MKSMSKNQVDDFLGFLRQRIDWHFEKMAGTLSYNRVLIKTEKAEAEVILSMFLEILRDRPE